MDPLYCLRCKTAPLQKLEPLAPETVFYECSECGRNYACEPGKALTFRWLHPISLALYNVIFAEHPTEPGRVSSAAASLVEGLSDDQIAAFVEEIRLELNEPTQNVRDILDCRAPEQQLRLFLELVCDRVQNSLDAKE